MSNISSTIRSIRDIMRKDTGVDGDAQRISQLVWMLFLKIFSDKEEEWSGKDPSYVSPIPEQYKWQNWAANIDSSNNENLIEFINNALFPTLKSISNENKQTSIVRSVFEDTHNFMKNGGLVRQVITEIGKINFNSENETHVFNDIYETILKELQSAGSSGEYYTPRAVTQFMVDVVEPKLNDTILDPACGTGGFLTCAIDYIRADNGKNQFVQEANIRGVEKKPLPHMLCTTNLMLHGLAVPHITRGNLLSRPLDDWETKDQINVVFSNPPFGGTEEDGTENNFPTHLRTKETADLFVILIIKLLKQNGKAAIIVPDSFLFGEGVRTRIKKELLDSCNLHTIVRLPNGVFNPYTNIKTNLLFFDKGRSTEHIWFFEHPYPENQRSYNRSKPIMYKEFELEKLWWNNRVETDYAWKVSINDIKKRNYNIDISSPYFGEEDEKLDTKEIIIRLDKSMQRTNDLLNTLKLKYE